MKTIDLLAAIFAACIPLLSNGLEVPGNAYDHVKNQYIPEGIRWMEVGFFLIVQDQWTSLSTTYTNFSDPVVFLSLPNLAGATSTEGKSMSLRVNNTKLTYIDHDTKNFEFEAKSISANDSFCTERNNFYTPSDFMIPASFIGWLVVERGMFNVSHKAFIIQTDVINRTNVNDSFDVLNQFKSFAPNKICDFGKNCALDDNNGVLTLAQLQTTRFDRFLLLRAIGASRRFVVYVLTPHDSLSGDNFLIPTPGENYAWMLFEEGLQVTCVENLIIETYLQPVTFIRITLAYANTFTFAPAVFGMVQTLRGRDSLGLRAFNIGTSSSDFITQEDKCTDAETEHTTEEDAALLIIGQANMGVIVCGATFVDSRPTLFPTAAPTTEASLSPTAEPTLHPSAVPTVSPTSVPTLNPTAVPTNDPTLSPTNVPTLDPTAVPTNKPTLTPSTTSPTPGPTANPTRAINATWCTAVTLYDTFGDGWGPDIALKITLPYYDEFSTILEPLYLYYECPEGAPKEFCWQEGDEVGFDIVALNPPAKETWEIYWTVNWQMPGDLAINSTSESQTFLGDFDTTMNATQNTFDVLGEVDYYNRSCSVCKHPPKPPAKAKPSPSAGKGHGSGSSTSTTTSTSSSSATDDLVDDDSVGSSGASKGEGPGGSGGKKAKGPGAQSKPKPHWPFPVTIFDTNGDGWFNSSEAWTQVPLHTCGGGVSFPDGRALPETLTTPEYIISTIDRVKPLRRNQICGNLLKEDCEERLPDAKYIFRVTGDLSKWDTQNDTAWHFCGKHGTSMEELEFKLIHGKCFPGKKTSAEDICCGDITASFSGLLTVHGVTDMELTEFDTALLEADVAEAFSTQLAGIHGSIALTSWSVSGDDLAVQFSMVFDPASFGLSGMYFDEMEALETTLVSSADAFIASGQFVSYMQSSLMHLPLGSKDVLSSMTSATISNVVYIDTTVDGHSVVTVKQGDEPGVLASDNAMSATAEQRSSALIVFEQSATVIFAAMIAMAVAITVYKSVKVDKEDHLSAESSRELLTEETDALNMVQELPPVF